MGKVITWCICVFICAVFASCGVTRKNVHIEEEKRFDAINTEKIKTLDVETNTNVFDITKICTSITDSELTFEIYDTSVKTDSGTYAVKAKGVLKTTKSDIIKTNVNDSIVENKIVVTDEETQNKVIEETKSKTKTKETHRQYMKFVLFVTMIALLCVLSYILKRRINNYKL